LLRRPETSATFVGTPPRTIKNTNKPSWLSQTQKKQYGKANNPNISVSLHCRVLRKLRQHKTDTIAYLYLPEADGVDGHAVEISNASDAHIF
jgi:hypothetical protein